MSNYRNKIRCDNRGAQSSLSQHDLRVFADFVAILGIIAKIMPLWQRNHKKAKKCVVTMLLEAMINYALPQKY